MIFIEKYYIGIAGYRKSGKSLIAEIIRQQLGSNASIVSPITYVEQVLGNSRNNSLLEKNIYDASINMANNNQCFKMFLYLQDIIRFQYIDSKYILIDDLINEKFIEEARKIFPKIKILYIKFEAPLELSAICESKRVEKPFENIDKSLAYKGRPISVHKDINKILSEWSIK